MSIPKYYYILTCMLLTSCVTEDLTEIQSFFSPKSPSEVARDANNRESPDLQREGINKLSTSTFGGVEVYVELYRDRLLYKETSGGPLVQAACLRALGIHGEVDDAILIAKYLDIEKNQSQEVRLAAAKSLQRIHNKKIISNLTSTIRNIDEWYEVRIASIYALGQYKEERILDLLIDLLDDTKLSINLAAHDVLKFLTGKEFSLERSDWLDWYQAERKSDLFFNSEEYKYPVYSRKLSWWENIPFFMPKFEKSLVPKGIYGKQGFTTYENNEQSLKQLNSNDK